jgi:hypothetical protein
VTFFEALNSLRENIEISNWSLEGAALAVWVRTGLSPRWGLWTSHFLPTACAGGLHSLSRFAANNAAWPFPSTGYHESICLADGRDARRSIVQKVKPGGLARLISLSPLGINLVLKLPSDLLFSLPHS